MPQKLLLRPVLAWGLVLGLVIILLFELSYVSGSYLTWWGGLTLKGLTSLSYAVVVFMGLSQLRWIEQANLSSARAMVYGIFIGAVAGLIVSTHEAIFVRFVDPSYTERVLNAEVLRQRAQREIFAAQTPRPDYLIEQADKALATLEKGRAEVRGREADVSRMLLGGLSSAVFGCVIAALLMSFLLRGIELPLRKIKEPF